MSTTFVPLPSPSDIPSAASITPPVNPILAPPAPQTSIVASARRLTSQRLKGGSFKKPQAEEWQEDAWDMYDLVGEQRFLAATLANRMSQAHLFVGKYNPDTPNEPPEPVDDEEVQSILDAVGDTPTGLAQLIQRLGVNLWVAGDGWLAGIPKGLVAEAQMGEYGDPENVEEELAGLPMSIRDDGATLDDLDWKMLSVSEVKTYNDGRVELSIGANEKIETTPDDVYMIRVWRGHPRKSWEADSPTRSSLPVLRELVGLTMHISAQVDSRLAGAGILFAPESASRALKRALNLPEDGPDDPFTDALIEAMVTPISDRSNASALVPLVLTVPDDTTNLFKYMSFASELDREARDLRDEAIRRLALGQDAPPELLLGTGGMNHWGAWLVREDVVTTHIEPPLALICDALTTQYLHPVLRLQGMDREEAEEYVIWYDVSHMIMRPNRAQDAIVLYDKGVISDETLRDATGFDESDAPISEQQTGGEVTPESPDQAKEAELAKEAGMKALDLAIANPALVIDPGLAELARQVLEVLSGDFTGQPAAEVVPPEDATEEVGDASAESIPEEDDGTPFPADQNSPAGALALAR